MVACMSPAADNYEESLSTLRYANRAKSIQNRPRINEDPKDALLREYQEEIKQLKALLTGQLGTANLTCETKSCHAILGYRQAVLTWLCYITMLCAPTNYFFSLYIINVISDNHWCL